MKVQVIKRRDWDRGFIPFEIFIEDITEFSREKLKDIGKEIIDCKDFDHSDFPAHRVFDPIFSPGIIDMEISENGQVAIILLRASTGYGNNTQSALYKLKITEGGIHGFISEGIRENCPKQRTEIKREGGLCKIRCYDKHKRKMIEYYF
jgi:hypothetical protein